MDAVPAVYDLVNLPQGMAFIELVAKVNFQLCTLNEGPDEAVGIFKKNNFTVGDVCTNCYIHALKGPIQGLEVEFEIGFDIADHDRARVQHHVGLDLHIVRF